MVDKAPQEGCRLAGPDDVPRLAALAQQAVSELQGGRGGEVWARHLGRQAPYEETFTFQIADRSHRVLIGTLDGDALAYAVAHIEVLRDGGRLGVVDDLYTEPGARELGLGEIMMQSLMDWCTEQGCFGVDSLALPGDRHTKNFFETFGLVARALVVHRPLP